MATIFIAYSSRHRYAAGKLAEFLHAKEHRPWWDSKITPADIWNDAIKGAIEDSEIFMYLLSEDSLDSFYCRQEYNFAVDLKKRFVPVQMHEQCPVPEHMAGDGGYQLVKMFGHDISVSEDEVLQAISNAKPLKLIHKLDVLPNVQQMYQMLKYVLGNINDILKSFKSISEIEFDNFASSSDDSRIDKLKYLIEVLRPSAPILIIHLQHIVYSEPYFLFPGKYKEFCVSLNKASESVETLLKHLPN